MANKKTRNKMRLIWIVTLGKRYLCDNCEQLHKPKETDLILSQKWYRVSQECANNIMTKARKCLRDGMLGK